MEEYTSEETAPLEKCCRDVAGCDVYLGFFGFRYGYTPTGSRTSITEAEYRQAVASDKRVLIFLASEDCTEIAPKNIDRDSTRIDALREELAGSHTIHEFFRTPTELANQVLTALARMATTDSLLAHVSHISTARSPRGLAEQIAAYLRWLQENTKHIELRGIERAGGSPVVLLPLEQAFVPLRAIALSTLSHAVSREPGVGESVDSGDESRLLRSRTDSRSFTITQDQLLSLAQRIAVIGGPGSGKTTVLLNMAWALATSILDGAREPAATRLGLLDKAGEPLDAGSLPLPIFVSLSAFARYRRHLPPHVAAIERTLAHFIGYHLMSKQANFDLPADFFAQLLRNGHNVLLLLDGLDEVANEVERAETRQAVEDLVRGREELRVVVTCRTMAYRGGRTALAAGFREIEIAALDRDEHIRPMVHQAYRCIYPHDAIVAATRADDLLDGIAQLEHQRRGRLGKDAARLVSNPLMVRLVLIVHVSNRRLPDRRSDLLEKSIEALMQVDYGRDEGDIVELSAHWRLYTDMAQRLAYALHEIGVERGLEIDENGARLLFSRDDEFSARTDDFFAHVRQRGSVVEERDGWYRFVHLAFQEFLAARYLREVVGADGRDAIVSLLHDRVADSWWREPVLLLSGYWASRASGPARQFIMNLAEAGKTPESWIAAAELAAAAALEWRDCGQAVLEHCARRIVQLLERHDVLDGCRPAFRTRAAESLSRLGDPRFSRKRFQLPEDDDLGFVDITTVPRDGRLRPFKMGRYPVTVGQFRAYESTRDPRAKHFRLDESENRPVRWVGADAARAYCDWLTHALATSPVFDGHPIAKLVRNCNWYVDLPTDEEWEVAANGTEPATSACRLERTPGSANLAAAGLGDSCPVGCFPPLPNGLHDMVGNVWEWTQSLWGERLDLVAGQPTGKSSLAQFSENRTVLRIARGGAWNSTLGHARYRFRRGFLPDVRSDCLGFRLVLREIRLPSEVSAQACPEP